MFLVAGVGGRCDSSAGGANGSTLNKQGQLLNKQAVIQSHKRNKLPIEQKDNIANLAKSLSICSRTQ